MYRCDWGCDWGWARAGAGGVTVAELGLRLDLALRTDRWTSYTDTSLIIPT